MPHSLLLFDVDGTLLKTGGAGMAAMNRVIRKLFGDDFTLDGIQVSGHLDPLIFAEAAAINGLNDAPSHHDTFRDHYIAQLEEDLAQAKEQVHALRGVHDLLTHLRQRVREQSDVVLGLLTGNYTQAVPVKLTAVGIDPAWFQITAFGDEAPSRADLVALAMDKYKTQHNQPIENRRVVVIGDTPRDVACAKAHGCIAFAVATGSFDVDQLREAGADIAVKDLSDPTPLINLMDSV